MAWRSRDDSARRRREILISAQVVETAAQALFVYLCSSVPGASMLPSAPPCRRWSTPKRRSPARRGSRTIFARFPGK